MGIFDNISSRYDESGIPFGYRLMMMGQILQNSAGGGGGFSGNTMAHMMKEARERAAYNRSVQSAIEYAKKVDDPELLYMVQNGLISPSDLVGRVHQRRDLEDQRSWQEQQLQDQQTFQREQTQEQRAYEVEKAEQERIRKATDWSRGMEQGPSANAIMPTGPEIPERLRRLRVLTGIPDLTEEEGRTVIAAGPELGPKAIENIQKQRTAKAEAERALSTEDTKEYDRAVAQGYKGTLEDWVLSTKRAGATQINTGETLDKDGIILGKIPEGHGLLKDPSAPGGYRMIPLAGTDDAHKIAEDALKAREAAGISATRARTALGTISNIKRLAEDSTMPVVGKFTQIPFYGFMNPSYESVKNELEALGGAIAMENLGDIRATSPTGGALGSITEMENRMMMGYYGNIQQSTDEETFNINLDRVADQWRQFVRRNRKAAELFVKARETGNYEEFNNWVAEEEAKLANELYKEFGEEQVDSLSEKDRIKSLIVTDPEDTPPGGIPPVGKEVTPPGPAGSSPPPGDTPPQPPPGKQGALGTGATSPAPTPVAPQEVAVQLPIDENDVAYLVPKVNELPEGYTVDHFWGANQPKEYGVNDQTAMVLDPNGRMVGTVEPDGRIRRADFKAYTVDQLDEMEGRSGERVPGQRKRREVLAERSKMPWPEFLGTTANDIARVGAKGITFGGLDWLLGGDQKSQTRESKIRLGMPGELAEITGNVISPIARPISMATKVSPILKGGYEKLPGVLKWLGGGAEGAGVAGASALFNDGNAKLAAPLGGIIGLGAGALGPLFGAVARGALGFPSRVGGKAIGEAYKQGATSPVTTAEAIEKQTFKDVMAGRTPDKFQSQYKTDYSALYKKFIPGNQNIVSDATKKKVAADLKARPATNQQSDNEVKQMMKILAAPKGKGKNTIRDWDKVYRDLERFTESKDAYVAEKARHLREVILTNLSKVDPKFKKMVENREAGLRGGKAGGKFSGIDPQHVEQLLLASTLLSPLLAATGTLTVPRIAGNIAYKAGQVSQNAPSWGGFGGILEKLMEERP